VSGPAGGPVPAGGPRPSPPAAPAPGPADADLVAAALAGDAGAFEGLMRRYNQRLYRLARSIVGEPAEAEDVVQETFVRAWTRLGTWEGRASFSTWLCKIAVHEALARARKSRRFAALPDPEAAAAASPGPSRPAEDPERDAATGELRRTLEAAVDALPESLRAVFALREVEGLSTAETAEALGLSVPNVKVRLHRARAALRSDLERRMGAELRHVWAFAGRRCDRIVESVLERIGEGRAPG